MIIWVIGAGGLLGSAVVRSAGELGHAVKISSDIPWSDPGSTVAAISRDALELRQSLTSEVDTGTPWGIVWAAGRATAASETEEINQELATFEQCLKAINAQLADLPHGTFTLASSAGGVYAGSSHPPFSSTSEPDPLGPYGHLKLTQEQRAREILDPRISVLIARIANVYGPGQDLRKLQGLISRLALTGVTKKPLTMFVPLDTLRDYITADDAAARLLHWITAEKASSSVRVIASGQATSLGYLINLVKDITRTSTPIAYGMHASAAYQSADLRLIPDTDPAIEKFPLTGLPEGVKDIYADTLRRHQDGWSKTG